MHTKLLSPNCVSCLQKAMGSHKWTVRVSFTYSTSTSSAAVNLELEYLHHILLHFLQLMTSLTLAFIRIHFALLVFLICLFYWSWRIRKTSFLIKQFPKQITKLSVMFLVGSSSWSGRKNTLLKLLGEVWLDAVAEVAWFNYALLDFLTHTVY